MKNTFRKLGIWWKKTFIKKAQSGFTLIELLIAISLFAGFMVLVSNSYIDIVRAQKTANETRQMYSEMRNLVDFVNAEMREGNIDYFCYESGSAGGFVDPAELIKCPDVATYQIDSGNNLRVVSKDGLQAATIVFDQANKSVLVYKYKKEYGSWVPEIGYASNISNAGTAQQFAFSNLQVNDLRFDIYPKKNPAKIDNADLSNQLQPMVLMSAEVASRNPSVNFNLHFQTMITSRAQ